MPIKYLGSKRRLVPVLGELFCAAGARTALDLFTGTTRVAQELKSRGGLVTAVDLARYAEVFARCYIETAGEEVDRAALESLIRDLDALPGAPGYFTQTFCVESRFFQPFNGERIDAIRDALEEHRGSPWFPILLTSLLEAADRVDSTTGVQMAYVKQWAPRSFGRLTLRVPTLLAGAGRAVRADACRAAAALGTFDFAYLDPPYNQHRYYTNYHIWETLVAWDAPEHYGVACKRVDARDDTTKSVFNQRRAMPAALRQVIADVDARVVVLSYNDEAWVSIDELVDMCAVHGDVRVRSFDSKRYVGAQIGIHNPSGEKVGAVSHLRNLEHLVISGPRRVVDRLADVTYGAHA
ncbi:MAG: site-specific DNA-methyltransferase [Acidimicrobiia bacterium]